jgi:hypothetical protein
MERRCADAHEKSNGMIDIVEESSAEVDCLTGVVL